MDCRKMNLNLFFSKRKGKLEYCARLKSLDWKSGIEAIYYKYSLSSLVLIFNERSWFLTGDLMILVYIFCLYIWFVTEV